eukprot:359651-Chlamydomonas_euryale.AAC.9
MLALAGTDVTVTVDVFSDDGSSAIVTLCRDAPGAPCVPAAAAAPAAAAGRAWLPPQSYWQLRSLADASSCVAVGPPISGGRPGERSVVFASPCSSPGPGGVGAAATAADVWFWDGLMLRYRATRLCLDPTHADRYAKPGPIVAAPCEPGSRGGGGVPELRHVWLWPTRNRSALALPGEPAAHWLEGERDRLVSRWITTSLNMCPTRLAAPGGGGGGSAATLAYAPSGAQVCTSPASAFPAALATRVDPSVYGEDFGAALARALDLSATAGGPRIRTEGWGGGSAAATPAGHAAAPADGALGGRALLAAAAGGEVATSAR